MNQLMVPKVHVNTRNLSALKMHQLFKDLGIKNNKFFLTIYDEGLMYIDPFSPSLSVEMQRRVHAEIVRNYWYYVREIVRINVPGGVTMFEFHRGNIAASYLMLMNINFYLELPRQMTKTGTIATFFSYVWGFKSINSKAAFLSKDPESVKSNLEDVKIILNNLPPYLRMLDPKTDTDNRESIFSPRTNNSIVTRSPPGNEAAAINKGRGSREPLQWNDELPHINFIKLIVLNSSSSWQASAEFAKRNGVPYSRIFSSTPGILGTDKGDFVFEEFLPQCAPFDEKLVYDQESVEKIRDHIATESKNDFFYIRFTYRQLGKGQDYYNRQCRILQNDMETIDREVNLKWSRRSTNSPFSREQLDRVFTNLKNPIGTIIIQDTYILKLYSKPDWKKKYIVSVDCSGMTDNDYSSVCVIDPETFDIVGTLRSNARTLTSNTTRFSIALIDILKKIFPNALGVIEKNNMGVTVIDNIITFAPELIPRMYSSAYEPSARDVTGEFGVSRMTYDGKPTDMNPDRVVYGFNTIAERRSQMFREIIGVVMTELYTCINDHDIYIELNNIIKNDKGRIDHKHGKHDDMLFSYLIGLWVLAYSKILYTRYGYNITDVRPLSVMDETEVESQYNKRLNPEDTMTNVGRMITDSLAKVRDTFDPNTRESFDEEVGLCGGFGNISIGDAVGMVYGQTSHILDDDDYTDEPEITEYNEDDDIQNKASKMGKSERDVYFREVETEELVKRELANNRRIENLKKARTTKEQRKLERLIKDNKDSDSHIDILLNNSW